MERDTNSTHEPESTPVPPDERLKYECTVIDVNSDEGTVLARFEMSGALHEAEFNIDEISSEDGAAADIGDKVQWSLVPKREDPCQPNSIDGSPIKMWETESLTLLPLEIISKEAMAKALAKARARRGKS